MHNIKKDEDKNTTKKEDKKSWKIANNLLQERFVLYLTMLLVPRITESQVTEQSTGSNVEERDRRDYTVNYLWN
jgi:hypothetical protein